MGKRIAKLKNVKDKNISARGDIIYLLTKEVIENEKSKNTKEGVKR